MWGSMVREERMVSCGSRRGDRARDKASRDRSPRQITISLHRGGKHAREFRHVEYLRDYWSQRLGAGVEGAEQLLHRLTHERPEGTLTRLHLHEPNECLGNFR